MRNTCKSLYFNPNKHVWKHNRKGKISTENNPFSSRCYTKILRPSFSFHFMYACWEYSRKSHFTLNSSQPNRERHLKILSLTRWVMTAGESKAELSMISENLGHSYPKQGHIPDLLMALGWQSGCSCPCQGWIQGGDTKAGHSRGVLSLWHSRICLSPTSPPGRYSHLSCSMIFTNDLSPNLLNIMINVLEINQLKSVKMELLWSNNLCQAQIPKCE